MYGNPEQSCYQNKETDNMIESDLLSVAKIDCK